MGRDRPAAGRQGALDWLHGAWAVFEKDLRLELRSRYAINMLLLFVLAASLLVGFALGQGAVEERVAASMIWVVILFSASLGLGRAFVGEEERGTTLLLRLNTRGSMVFAGKLLFNLLLTLGLNVVAVVVLVILLRVPVAAPGLLAATLGLGAIGLAGATTLLAALIARAASRGPLLPVLLFPVLVPLLLSVVSATRIALAQGARWDLAAGDLMTLFSLAGVILTASVLLFDYIWND